MKAFSLSFLQTLSYSIMSIQYPIIAIKVLKNLLKGHEKGLDNAGQFSLLNLFELVCAEVDSYGAQKVNILTDCWRFCLMVGFYESSVKRRWCR